jgi:hypothetical protein
MVFGNHVHASSLKKLKDETILKVLYRWVRLLHRRMTKHNALDLWEIPHINDISGLLSIVCRGSPKLHATHYCSARVSDFTQEVDYLVFPFS